MTTINDLKATIGKLREAHVLAKPALADQALAQAEALFRAYDEQLGEQRITIDNLRTRIGALETRLAAAVSPPRVV